MSFTSEGTIEIDLADFWEWVHKEHLPVSHGTEIRFGVPRVNKSNMTLDIDFAAATDNDPCSWAVKPKAVTQWQEPECAPTDVAQCAPIDVAQTEPSDVPFSPCGDGPVVVRLVVTQTFYDAVKLLAETEGIARADIIRKAVCRYAADAAESRAQSSNNI